MKHEISWEKLNIERKGKSEKIVKRRGPVIKTPFLWVQHLKRKYERDIW